MNRMSWFERRAGALLLARAGAFIADRIVRLSVLVSHFVYDESEGERWAFNLDPRHKS